MELNRIYNTDCIEGMKQIPPKSIHLNISDLPYGILECLWDKKIHMPSFWKENDRIMTDNGATLLTATMKFAIELINSNRKDFRYNWIWEKVMPVGFANSHKMPLRAHELVLVFYKLMQVLKKEWLKIKVFEVFRHTSMPIVCLSKKYALKPQKTLPNC